MTSSNLARRALGICGHQDFLHGWQKSTCLISAAECENHGNEDNRHSCVYRCEDAEQNLWWFHVEWNATSSRPNWIIRLRIVFGDTFNNRAMSAMWKWWSKKGTSCISGISNAGHPLDWLKHVASNLLWKLITTPDIQLVWEAHHPRVVSQAGVPGEGTSGNYCQMRLQLIDFCPQ